MPTTGNFHSPEPKGGALEVKVYLSTPSPLREPAVSVPHQAGGGGVGLTVWTQPPVECSDRVGVFPTQVTAPYTSPPLTLADSVELYSKRFHKSLENCDSGLPQS